MLSAGGGRWIVVLALTAGCLLSTPAPAHPGSGIVVDRDGQIFFVDMVSGVWKLDVRGALTHIPGPAFHWMTLDAGARFGASPLPSGPGWEIARIDVNPRLLLASDFPIAVGRDGNLYYPSHGSQAPLRVLKAPPSGQTSTLAILSGTAAGGPLRDLNGLAAGPDGAVYYTENDAIRRISGEGRISTVVENVALAGCMSRPLLRGLDVEAGGTIYVAATGCGRVLKVTPAGHVSLLPQIPGAWAPTGVALSGNDLYVLEFQHADSDERREMLPRVTKIAPDGKTAIVGTVIRH